MKLSSKNEKKNILVINTVFKHWHLYHLLILFMFKLISKKHNCLQINKLKTNFCRKIKEKMIYEKSGKIRLMSIIIERLKIIYI